MNYDEQSIYVTEYQLGWDTVADAASGLLDFARDLTTDSSYEGIVAELVAGRTFGWLTVTEMLTNFEQSPVNTLLGVKDDGPETRRTRMILGIDVEGRTYSVLRQEGRDPVDMSEHRPHLHGQLPAALIFLNMAIANRVRGGEVWLEKLQAIPLLSTDEIDALALDASPFARMVADD